MAFPTRNETNFEYELIDEGLYPARLVRIIELGKQRTEYKGEVKENEQVVLSFVLTNVKKEYDGERKMTMVSTYPLTVSLNDKAKLAQYINAINANATQWEDLIDKPCMLEIGHVMNSKGEKRHTIKNVTRPMAGLEIPEADCESYIFSFDNPDKEIWDKLTEFRQDQIKAAVNFEGSAVQAMLEG